MVLEACHLIYVPIAISEGLVAIKSIASLKDKRLNVIKNHSITFLRKFLERVFLDMRIFYEV